MIEKAMDTHEVQLWRGDCREVMSSLPDSSVDSIVTDPPYELGFMGKGWDSSGIAFDAEVWAQALRVLKPGGHLLAFGGTRTWHRVAVAIEDAGFEIRDSLAWLYGSGFPKSLNVGKAIDAIAPRVGMFDGFAEHYASRRRALGMTHADVCAIGGFFKTVNHGGASVNWEKGNNVPTAEQWSVLAPVLGLSDEWLPLIEREETERVVKGKYRRGIRQGVAGLTTAGEGGDITAPASEEARQWDGWGTALKPAFEPIVFARKPLEGTVAANVLRHGTGAINIDASRIGDEKRVNSAGGVSSLQRVSRVSAGYRENVTKSVGVASAVTGRFPSNVLLDESQAAALDEQSGVLTSGLMKARTERKPRKGGTIYGADQRNITAGDTYADSGGASRFFYVAKAGRDERPVVDGDQHSTVKPLTLMRYLVKLVTPPGGTVLEPFAGSGTTLEAAVLEGFSVIGAELDEDGKHIPLILKRLSKPLTPAMF
ncbi:DNA methyltransferase [Leucobacter sp. NPDC015123]|uniref:DNA methyltransferase n=1 Tax=Leucobacter sp. NPDC015123 TaxID=3364129 RepID=UPI0036F48A9D